LIRPSFSPRDDALILFAMTKGGLWRMINLNPLDLADSSSIIPDGTRNFNWSQGIGILCGILPAIVFMLRYIKIWHGYF
jgi:hypothetical protein